MDGEFNAPGLKCKPKDKLSRRGSIAAGASRAQIRVIDLLDFTPSWITYISTIVLEFGTVVSGTIK